MDIYNVKHRGQGRREASLGCLLTSPLQLRPVAMSSSAHSLGRKWPRLEPPLMFVTGVPALFKQKPCAPLRCPPGLETHHHLWTSQQEHTVCPCHALRTVNWPTYPPTWAGMAICKGCFSVPTWLPSVVLIEVDEEAVEREVVLVAHSRPVPVGHIPLGEAHDQQEVIVAG